MGSPVSPDKYRSVFVFGGRSWKNQSRAVLFKHERKEKTDASGSYFSIEMSETDLEAGIVNGELPCQFA